MTVACVVGIQWGDEGKAKIIDHLAPQYHYIVRYQGGNNAGHTVVLGENIYKFHLIPSGILHQGVSCVLGNGMVLDPQSLLDEIHHLQQRGVQFPQRLFLSERAHLVLPYHRLLDQLREQGSSSVGSTKKGIGPCYSDKMARLGIRVVDLFYPEFLKKRLHTLVEEKNKIFHALYASSSNSWKTFDPEMLLKEYLDYGEQLKPYVADTSQLLLKALQEQKSILVEGAQGSLLDIDFGTYPYVTSSNSTTLGISAGMGIPPYHIKNILGVCKAYCTRVGEGPFPSELFDETGHFIREHGREYGTTTGRPRRCGWLDLIALRYAIALNGVQELALTKLDVLRGVKIIRVCVGYEYHGRRIDSFPSHIEALQQVKPVYHDFPGFEEDLTAFSSYNKLPASIQHFVEFLEKETNTRIRFVSTGPERSQLLEK